MLLSNLNARFDKNRGMSSKKGIPPPEKAPGDTVLQEPSARGSSLKAISEHRASGAGRCCLTARGRQGSGAGPEAGGERHTPRSAPHGPVGSGTRGGTAAPKAPGAAGPAQGAGGPTPGASPGAGAEEREAGAAFTVAGQGTSRCRCRRRRRRPGALTLGGRPLPSPARRSAEAAPASGGAGQGMCVRGGAFRRRSQPRAGCAAAAASRRSVPMPPPRLLLSASRAGARPAPLPGCLLRQRRRRL